MVCLYNIDNQTRALLDKYESVLGSYEAAYYVLSQNNGFPLDQTPSGTPSQLYADLKSSVGENEAIRKKAMTYTQPFYKRVGDWTMGQGDPTLLDVNGEPKTAFVDGTMDPAFQDILNNHFLRDDLDDILDVNDYNADPTNEAEQNVALQRILNTSYDAYVNEEIKKSPDKSEAGIRKARRAASHEWYKRKVKQIVQEQQLSLAKAFGLDFITNNDGSIELRGTEQYDNSTTGTPADVTKFLRIKFVQNLNYDPLEDERRAIFGEERLDQKFREIDPNHNMYVADAVVDANNRDMLVARNGLIYISLNNGNAQTLSKVLTYHYITTYFDSPLIKAAIEAVLPESHKYSDSYKVAKLVEYLTGVGNKDAYGTSILDKFYANNKDLTEDQQKQVQFFSEFWNNFNDLNDQIINKGVRSAQARKKILSTVAAAILIGEKDIKSGSILDNPIPGDFYFRYMPSSKEKIRQEQNVYQGLFNKLQQAYENRKKRADKLTSDMVNQNAIKSMLLALEDLKSYNYNNINDVRKAITTLLENAVVEIKDASDGIDQLDTNPYTTNVSVTEAAKQLSLIFSDVIGFYKALINDVNDIIIANPDISTISVDRFRKGVVEELSLLESKYKQKLSTTAFRVVDIYIDKYWGDDLVSPAEKQNMKSNAHAYLMNQAMNGDISSYETIITMNSYSRSSICRIVFDAISRINKQKGDLVRVKAVELAQLLEKTKKELLKQGKVDTMLLGSNFQRVFQERDENGIPTGYITRPLNYGKFYKARAAAIERFATEIQNKVRQDIGDLTFSFERGQNGNIIFPDDDFFEPYYKEYMLNINHFDCTHANKMYTEEYYEKRIQMLSRKTIQAQNDIQNKIDIILTPVMQDGIPHPERLSKDDLIELMYLQIQQDTLGSRYDIFGHLKTGDDLQIANEILAFRDAVKDGREFSTDWDKYEESTKKLSQQEKDLFDSYMTTWQIQSEYWDAYNKLKEEYRQQFPPQFNSVFKRMDEINKEKREIMSYINVGHYYDANLEQLSDDAFERIKDLDIESGDLAKQCADYIRTLGDAAIPSAFQQLGDMMLYSSYNANNQYVSKYEQFLFKAIQDDKDESKRTGVTTHDNYTRALELYSIEKTDPFTGQIVRVPTSAFYYMKPKNVLHQSVINRFNLDPNKLVKLTPNKAFNYLSGGKYKNDNFDQANPERLQPLEENPNYKKITSNSALEALYNKLLEVIAEANSMIPNTRNNSNYRLPQIGASSMTMYSRGHIYNPLPAVEYAFDRTFNVNESDTEINDDYYTLPDGTRINNVPLRYIDQLRNPEALTADVVGSIIAYYDMAVNYSLKQKAAPILELLSQQVQQDSQNLGVRFSGKQTEQYSKLKNIMESRLYDNDAVWGTNRTSKLSTAKKREFKAAKFISKFGVLSALSRNFISYGTGFIDASGRMWANALQGDLYNVKDFFKGIANVFRYIVDGHFLLGVGSYLPNNHLSALMQKNQLSTGEMHHFQNTHKSRFRRSLAEIKTGMAGFRISDYLINGALLTAVYNNIRYYENNGVGTFLSETEWKNRYMRENNATMRQASQQYDKADVFYNAYQYDRNVPVYGKIRGIQLKGKYKVSTEELHRVENDTAKILQTQQAKLNGAVPNEDKAAAHQNPIINTISQLRTYLINDFQTRWATGDDFQDMDTSQQNINQLKVRRSELKKLLKQQHDMLKKAGNLDYQKAIDEIERCIQETETELMNSSDSSVILNKEYWKNAAKSLVMGIPMGATLGATLDAGLTTLFSGAHGVVFATGAILGGISAAALSLYNDAVNKNAVVINKKLSLNDRLIALQYMRDKLLGGESADFIRAEIGALDKKIFELTNLNKQRKGFANFALRQKCLGYNRALGSALTTLINKLKFFYRTNFVNSWKDLSDVDLQKLRPKFTRLEKIGVRRCLGDMSNIMFWMILASLLYGFKNDDPELVVLAKVADSAVDAVFGTDKPIQNALGDAYQWGNQRLDSLFDIMLNNDFVQGGASSLYDFLQNHNVIPFDNDVIERMIERKLEMVLGKKGIVKSKRDQVKYKKEANTKQFRELTKSYWALQSLRAFSEFAQPYDPTSINDMLSTTSATANVEFKQIEAGIHQFTEMVDGKSGKHVQRGPYTTFTKSQYNMAKSPFRVTGIPTLFEETDESGLDSRANYTRSLGINPVLFPKKDSTKKNQKPRKR